MTPKKVPLSAVPLPIREHIKTLDLKPRRRRHDDEEIPRAWRPSSLARHWGMSKQSVYRLCQSGELKSIKICGATRIPESAAVEYWERAKAE